MILGRLHSILCMLYLLFFYCIKYITLHIIHSKDSIRSKGGEGRTRINDLKGEDVYQKQ